MTSELVDHLIEILNEEGVVYCHWKSNFALPCAMAGKTDLDLLVERKSLSLFLTILMNLGFKQANVKGDLQTPGVSHYYGLDPCIDPLIHVHLFSRVHTGESFLKSHLLPFERMLLDNTDFFGHVRVPSKSAELIIFTIRTFIKYGSLLDVIYMQRDRKEIRAELHWLQSGADISDSLVMLGKYCPVIEESLFLKCIDSLERNTSIFTRINLANQVRRRLKVYSNRPVFKRIIAYAQLLWERGWRYLRGDKKNKTLSTGGAVVAFVGPEATGKSTLVAACGHWLGDVFTVKMVHAGKPPSSWLTAPINLSLPFVRRLLPRLRTSRLESKPASANPSKSQPQLGGLSSLIYALGAVTVAWDRRNLLQKARRSANNGEIVICDRYPSEAIGAMDSPRLHENAGKSGLIALIYNSLARLEQRLYQQIPPPDIALRLKVSIETAKKRNRERIKAGKESDAYIEFRHRKNREWHRSGTGRVFDIDTEQTEEQTFLCVKKAVWESL